MTRRRGKAVLWHLSASPTTEDLRFHEGTLVPLRRNGTGVTHRDVKVNGMRATGDTGIAKV